MVGRDEVRVFESVTEEVRERMNPRWRGQLRMHYAMLGIEGPVAMNFKEIIKRSLERQGLSMSRKRKRLG